MKIIKPKKYKDMYVALDNGKPLYAFDADKRILNKVYMLNDECKIITLPEFKEREKGDLSGDIMLGKHFMVEPKVNLAITNPNTTVKIPYDAFVNSRVNLFIPKEMALYYVIRKDVTSRERQLFTSYLLVAEKGLENTKGHDTEYHLKELENNKKFHNLKTGDLSMSYEITSHAIDMIEEKQK